jgi:hypothetical protein
MHTMLIRPTPESWPASANRISSSTTRQHTSREHPESSVVRIGGPVVTSDRLMPYKSLPGPGLKISIGLGRPLRGRLAPGELILPNARSLVAGLELMRGSSVLECGMGTVTSCWARLSLPIMERGLERTHYKLTRHDRRKSVVLP